MWDVLDRADLDPRDRERSGYSGEGVVTKWRYVPGRREHARSALQQQVHYIQRGAGADDGDTGGLFTAQDDGVARAAARDLVWESRGRSACFHRYILSPTKGLHLETAAELREWTRATMTAYGEHLGRELTYVAAVHMHPVHPHVHVVIAGRGRILESPERAARRRSDHKNAPTHKDVIIKEPDHAALKGYGLAAARPFMERAELRAKADRAARRAEQWTALDARLGIVDRPQSERVAYT